MPRRLTNLLLLGLVAALIASGLLGWLLPEPGALPLYGLHRALGVGLLLLLAWKLPIARRSLARRLGPGRARDRSVLLGGLAGLALAGSLGLGLAWTLGLLGPDAFGGYSPLNLHVFLGLGLLPLMLWHLARRWERRPAARTLLGRRSALRLLGLSAATVVGWRLIEGVAEARLSEARRPSGSRHAGSFSGNDFPVTSWLFDQVPLLDPADYRLELSGRLAVPGRLRLDELLARPSRELTVVLDCTGGWWSEQRWRGVPLGELLAERGADPGARLVTVVSVTGHRWSFPLAELGEALLATHVGGEVLAPGRRYPVRLVVPGRRGFQWVKWVGRIEVAEVQTRELHRWDLSAAEATALQRELRGQLRLEDALRPSEVRFVAGADIAYARRGASTTAYAAVIVFSFPELEPVETRLVQRPVEFPYVPGLLSFREAPAILEACRLVTTEPDVLLFDAQGYAHPRRLGAAAHLGLLLDKPSIGCAKSRLVGRYDEPGAEFGARSPLLDRGEVIGMVVRTRPGRKPLFVSAGHRISLETAVEIVLACCRQRSQMPEPTRLADRLVREEARREREATEAPARLPDGQADRGCDG